MRVIHTKPGPALEPEPLKTGLANWIFGRALQHPMLAIWLVSLLAVIINCYPVIFCGRSYVSPTSVGVGGAMVYERWPQLPEIRDYAQPMYSHGSDTWATMLWAVPAGFVESRSLLEHGEIPLWNRYSHAGDTLIGQAVSMLGDPLQLIVILGRGSAGAWDIKFLTAKLLFCAGFGLLILRLLGNWPLSLLYAVLAAYSGAFFYINNHPAFFVFCYAPWILLSALAWLDLQSERHNRWGVVWLLANFACFNAGHIEVAVDLIGGLNLAALACACVRCRTLAGSARVLGRMTVGTLLFLGLTAPTWMSFLGALQNSYSAHSEIQAVQLPLKCLLGLFDDFFYCLLVKTIPFNAIAPGTSLLVLVGCVVSAWKWSLLKGESFFWVNSGAIVLWGGCVFGGVPAFVLEAVPLLNRVGHVYTDFSYLLVIHLTIQSAYGFKCLAVEDNFRRAAYVFLGMAMIFEVIIVLAYAFGMMSRPVPGNYFLYAAAGAIGAPLLFLFLKSRYSRIPVLGWAGIVVLGLIPQYRFALYHGGDEDLLLIPGPRAVLDAPSRAVGWIQTDKSGPFRVVGLGRNFFGDYSAAYGLEDIRSCAPLSNSQFINLARNFPGMNLIGGWKLEVTNAVQAQPLLNLLNVKYLLAGSGTEVENNPGFRIADRGDFLVLENLQVWPRAFFSDNIVSDNDNEQFIRHLLENGRQPFIALSAEAMAKQPRLRQLKAAQKPTMTSATNYLLRPNSTAFDIHVPSAGVVCLTEGQAKDFTATANKEVREVLTVNCAFKGIYLDQPGDYHVQFTYRPSHWRLACALFWISTGAVIMLVMISLICVNGAAKNQASTVN